MIVLDKNVHNWAYKLYDPISNEITAIHIAGGEYAEMLRENSIKYTRLQIN